VERSKDRRGPSSKKSINGEGSIDITSASQLLLSDSGDCHLPFRERQPWRITLLYMIALSLSIASVDSPLWVNVVRNRFDRFKKVPFSDTESIVIIPGVGAVLLTDTGHELTVHAVAPDERTLDFIREGIANEITAAVPETARGHRLELKWDHPAYIPLPFR
jgi:hypothetical protein